MSIMPDKSVLISIRPRWCELIASGKKTVEVRKTAPKITTPFRCYIYCTKEERGVGEVPYRHFYQSSEGPKHFTGGTVIGEFICDRIYGIVPQENGYEYEFPYSGRDCLSELELYNYLGDEVGLGWHISNLKIYDEPRPLTNFHRPCPNGLYCEGCGMYMQRQHACGNSALQIRRPPQSWMYAEDQT